MKDEFEKALTEAFIVNLYSDTNPVQKKQNEWLGNCVFHNDKNPSFGFNSNPKDLGVYNCFSCAAQGNIYTYAREHLKETKPLEYLNEQLKIPITEDYKFTKKFLRFQEKCKNIDTNLKIPNELILEKKKLLLGNYPEKRKMLNDMGITDQVIKDYNLGFDGQRFWIPIKDKDGIFRNVRKYCPNSKIKVMSYATGYGDRRLWPIENLNSSTIYIMEGEKDTLIALSNGLNAVTSTAGGSNWDSDWGELFKDKKVIICMDIDQAGVLGAQKRAANIKKYANEIKIIEFPLDIEEYPGGDFSDYIDKFSIHDFDSLVTETKTLYLKASKENSEIHLNFFEAGDTRYAYKKTIIKNVRCIGSEENISLIPKKVIVTCTGSRNDRKCKTCILKPDNFILDYEFMKYDHNLLRFVQIKDSDLEITLRKALKITRKCEENEFDIQEYFSVQILRLKSDMGGDELSGIKKSKRRKGYYFYFGNNELSTNKNYTIKGSCIKDPKTSNLVHHIYEASEGQTSLDNFELTEDIIKKLSIFKVDYENGQTHKEKCDEIYSEFSNLAYIYERQDVFHVADIAYLSVLNYQVASREIEKGWSESLILGDGGTGKSKIVKFLLNHYRCGEMVSAESTTLAGLLASVIHMNGGWILQWGALPVNDTRLVVIEEMSGLSLDDIEDLSLVRTGTAIVTKVVQEETTSRTRIIWISNPRKKVAVKKYIYPVKLVSDLFGNRIEDVRRLDTPIILSRKETEGKDLRKKDIDFIPKYPSEACHTLVMFAWSRKPSDIYISKEVDEYIYQKGCELVKIYSDSIPLISNEEAQEKITRGSLSESVRVFSLNEDKKLELKKDHVDTYVGLLTRIFDSKSFGYRRYSLDQKKGDKLVNVEIVCDLLHLHDSYHVQELSSQHRMIPEQFKSFLVHEDVSCSMKEREKESRDLKILQKNNVYTQGTGNYYDFCAGFTDLLINLKDWYDEGKDLDSYLNTHIRVNEKETVNLD